MTGKGVTSPLSTAMNEKSSFDLLRLVCYNKPSHIPFLIDLNNQCNYNSTYQ